MAVKLPAMPMATATRMDQRRGLLIPIGPLGHRVNGIWGFLCCFGIAFSCMTAPAHARFYFIKGLAGTTGSGGSLRNYMFDGYFCVTGSSSSCNDTTGNTKTTATGLTGFLTSTGANSTPTSSSNYTAANTTYSNYAWDATNKVVTFYNATQQIRFTIATSLDADATTYSVTAVKWCSDDSTTNINTTTCSNSSGSLASLSNTNIVPSPLVSLGLAPFAILGMRRASRNRKITRSRLAIPNCAQ